MDFEGRVDHVIADGSRFVAVGGEGNARTAWTSNDGATWAVHDVPHPSMSEWCLENPNDPGCVPLGSTGMGRLVRLEDTLYSFASFRAGGDASITLGWRWTDGGQWEEILSTSEFFDGSGLAMSDIAAGDTALLAVKVGGLQYPGYYETWLWTSSTSWIKGELASTAEEEISIDAVSWSQRLRLFLAVGRTYTPLPDTDSTEWPAVTTVWSSADGRAWARAPTPEGITAICSLDAVSQGFVMVGETAAGGTVWISLDGLTWTASQLPGGPTGLWQCSVLELNDGLLALADDGATTLTWTSRDGSAWERGISEDVRMGPQEVAAVGDTVVLFGSRGDEGADVLLIGTAAP
jgi:hypothetical protein